MKLPLHHKIFLLVLVTGVAAFVSAATSFAQRLEVDQALSFGKFALSSAGDPAIIVIAPDGSYTVNSNVFLFNDPQIGEYTLFEAQPQTSYTVNLPNSVNLTGPGGNFVLDQLATTPETLTTDINGTASFKLYGRLRSTGGNAHYRDGQYNNNITIIFNF